MRADATVRSRRRVTRQRWTAIHACRNGKAEIGLTVRRGELPSVGRFVPARAADGLMGLRVQHVLSPCIGAIVLIAWAAALVAIGIVVSARQDIN
jgi:hypothetical protein